jgi:hypothetical protein
MWATKTCPQCKETLPASCFAKDPKPRSGLYSWCKQCKLNKYRKIHGPPKVREKRESKGRDKAKVKAYDRKRYLAMKAQILERNQRYNKTPEAKISAIASARRQREKFKEKFDTRYKTNELIRHGELVRQPCRVCGWEKSEVHHRNYSNPLDVDWLCRKHHMEEHQRLKELGITL